MNEDWKIRIEIRATSFALMQRQAVQFLKETANAASFRDIPTHNGCSGDGVNNVSFFVDLESPVKARITQLRQEADELEAAL